MKINGAVGGNVTSRQTFTWTEADNKTHSWEDNRESTWTYDADGRLKTTPENRYYYDAAGAVVMSTRPQGRREIRHLDGDGRAVRNSRYTYSSGQYNLTKSEYFIHSSVLGKVLTEVKSNGTKQKTNVYGPNGIVATQNYQAGAARRRSLAGSVRPRPVSRMSRRRPTVQCLPRARRGLDPLGSDVKTSNPYAEQPLISGPGTRWGDPFGGYRCMIDWVLTPYSMAAQVLSSGGGGIHNGPQYYNDGTGWGIFRCEAGMAWGYYFYKEFEFPDPTPEFPDQMGYGQNIYCHLADVDSGQYWFGDRSRIPSTHGDPIGGPHTGHLFTRHTFNARQWS